MGRGPDGRVVFVPGTAPGDRVRVRILEAHARYARAEALELLSASALRVTPKCVAFGECGGCLWQHVEYGAQVEAKARILGDALRRIGGLAIPDGMAIPFTSSPQAYGYRGRTRLRVEKGRVGYRRRRSHELCAVTGCPVLVPELERELRRLAEHPPKREGEWELCHGADASRARALGSASARDALELRVGGEALRISPGVFLQSNELMLETLRSAVLEAAGTGELAIELFAGAGFFTLGLAQRFARVVALEAQPEAVRDLGENLRRAGRGNVEVLAERLERRSARSALAGRAPDALVLDPPRTGLPRATLEPLAALGARRIAYLSCDPATLARDLAAFGRRGYALERVHGFDLFPQTPHVEALALLRGAS